MEPAGTTKIENLDAEIVVIGGGGAGLAAAIAAAEKGATRIIVLEKRAASGGNSVFAVGIFGAESRLQKHLGIDAGRDELFKKAMNYAHWKTDPRLVRALLDKSGDTIQWLEEKGVKFVRVNPLYPNQVPLTFHFSSGPGTTGAAVVRALVRSYTDLGVRLLCQTEAKRLLTDKKGGVFGVLARTKDKELSINAKGVVIATGGFAGNKELLKKYLPFYNADEMYRKGIPNKGDGLLIAAEVGAATDLSVGMVLLNMRGPSFPWSTALSYVAGRPDTIWVNKKGERFVDESLALFPESANSICRQPGRTSYTLFDEKIKKTIFEEGLCAWRENIWGISSRSWPTRVDEALRLQADKGKVKISDFWDEIAKWIGADPKVLKATIDEYNSFCNKGHDDLFLKNRRYLLPLLTPPYYAIQCCVDFVVTHGGIKVNHHMEVLDHQDNPIHGLYAAGVDIGGTDSDTYNANLTGHAFGFAISSGRIAGENAVKFIKAR